MDPRGIEPRNDVLPLWALRIIRPSSGPFSCRVPPRGNEPRSWGIEPLVGTFPPGPTRNRVERSRTPCGGFGGHLLPGSTSFHPMSASGGIRTHTVQLLELLPLPVGVQRRDAFGRIRTGTLQGSWWVTAPLRVLPLVVPISPTKA